MIFWIAALLMTVVAILCVLWPLSRGQSDDTDDRRSLEVYGKQLAELDEREAAYGSSEALSEERTEISRRILKEGRRIKSMSSGTKAQRKGRIAASLAALIGVPVICAVLYGMLGSPERPDVPLASVQSDKLEGKSLTEMVQIAERHLAKNPNDVKGWTVLANVYARVNRPADRARALEQIIRISGPSPKLIEDLGEALTVADGNIVPERARKLFETAWEQDKTVLKAPVYLAIALEQEGQKDEALERWRFLATKRLNDAKWQGMVSARISRLGGEVKSQPLSGPTLSGPTLSGPTREDVENASKMTAGDRQVMIESMVANLAEKLNSDPDNLEGWKRIIRSYTVLKRGDEASKALSTSLKYYKDQPKIVAELESLGVELKLKTMEAGN